MVDAFTRAQVIEASDETDRIVDACRPILAGHGPDIQGAALAELHPDLRPSLLEFQRDMIAGFVKLYEHLWTDAEAEAGNAAPDQH